MAAPAEHRTRINGSTFTKQRERCVKRSNVMHLQQHLQELKKRERQAQQHNKLLLLQFERAQDTLREMLARNATMKTIRMEYERYLEENSPRWQQQLQEKTQAAQKKRMEDSLRSYLKDTEEKQVTMTTVDGPLLSEGLSTKPQKGVATQTYSQENLHYSQDGPCYCPYAQSSCLTPSQSYTGRSPGVLRVPHQSHSPYLFPPPNLLPPQSFLHQHLTSTPAHHQLWSREDAAGWNNPGLWTAGIPPGALDQTCTEEPATSRVSQTVEEETSGSPSSNMEKEGGSKSCLSPDLDVKPVRLFSSRAESNESSRDSSLTSRQKRKKKRERRESSSSDSERCGSQRTSRKMSIASFVQPHCSERNTSSEDGSTRGSGRTKRRGPEGSPQSEGGAKEQEDEESQHAADEEEEEEEGGGSSEEVENPSHDNKLESRGTEEESGRKTQDEEEPDDQEGGSSDQSSDKDETKKKHLKPGGEEETENSQKSEGPVSDVEEDDDEASTRIKTTEEEAEDDGAEDWENEEESNKLKNKDSQIRKEASSQDEDEDRSEKIKEEDEGSNEEEAEESEDSEDIIVSPQDKRSKQMQMIPEEAAEDDDEGKTQSSNEFSDEDIENLLTPQEQTKKEEKHVVKTDGKPKASSHNMNIFLVSEDKSKTEQKSDSDEFDHFYD